ncbi:hypothetical protein K8089_12000 [Aequorivita sp. F47161]|uniref:Methylamine utilisation protein MauE domain-containing protein n=1 Tax=Aequorivita vitellina TaxID=2874475 RepID=A0A9X1U3Z4_9FLAO|nr:MauE/DoxX family redox-associated membrane protein [Aequorivita vitellina]MCG2419747.1 hypothetical protein [Aequorivita vitellina]
MFSLDKKYFNAETVVIIISYLYSLLFLYAAVSKLLDFETFTVQLAQSPLLSAFAGVIAWLVPGIEIAIAVLLMVPKFRTLGLYAAFTLMVMFTAYIFIILNYSDFIPCSCGGVLEKLSWTQHLIFNVIFIILAGVAVFFTAQGNNKKTLLLHATLAIIGIGIVALLFAFSEKKMHRNNAFQRRYPHHPANEVQKVDIGYNSYYFAGITEDSIYLGNNSAPLHVLAISKKTQDTLHRFIKLPNYDFPFRAIRVKVTDSIFYVMDGNVPVIFKGSLRELKGTLLPQNHHRFILSEPLDEGYFAIRAYDTITEGNILGRMSDGNSHTTHFYPNILKAYGDVFFDTDGLLLYNAQLKKIIYVYYYRNEYVTIENEFSKYHSGRTIDTISKPVLDVRTIASKNEKRLGKNPILVNIEAATFGNYLLIQSERLGKYESEKMLDGASIIDVYNLEDRTYVFSFYLYHPGLNNTIEFRLDGELLYLIVDHFLITYKLKAEYFTLDSRQ